VSGTNLEEAEDETIVNDPVLKAFPLKQGDSQIKTREMGREGRLTQTSWNASQESVIRMNTETASKYGANMSDYVGSLLIESK
jgi:hypothetical protein